LQAANLNRFLMDLIARYFFQGDLNSAVRATSADLHLDVGQHANVAAFCCSQGWQSTQRWSRYLGDLAHGKQSATVVIEHSRTT